jgi:hypothetical protein
MCQVPGSLLSKGTARADQANHALCRAPDDLGAPDFEPLSLDRQPENPPAAALNLTRRKARNFEPARPEPLGSEVLFNIPLLA